MCFLTVTCIFSPVKSCFFTNCCRNIKYHKQGGFQLEISVRNQWKREDNQPFNYLPGLGRKTHDSGGKNGGTEKFLLWIKTGG